MRKFEMPEMAINKFDDESIAMAEDISAIPQPTPNTALGKAQAAAVGEVLVFNN
ncbi:MAG: hypothetical protein ACI38A_06450 [Candidatus Ornithomonoglobus sp.]